MKRIKLLLPAICLALIPFAAKADTLTFNSAPTGSIGPYSMTLNGVTDLNLFCLNDKNFISPNETWQVDVLVGASSLNSNSQTAGFLTQYEEAAYVYSKFGSSSADAVQNALWEIFDSTRNISGDSAAVSLFNAAVLNFGSINLSNFAFYVYVPKSNITNFADGDTAVPQYFIGVAPLSITSTPEPSTLVMLGTGLTAMAGIARRKLVRG